LASGELTEDLPAERRLQLSKRRAQLAKGFHCNKAGSQNLNQALLTLRAHKFELEVSEA
jgi:hypothetical protein